MALAIVKKDNSEDESTERWVNPITGEIGSGRFYGKKSFNNRPLGDWRPVTMREFALGLRESPSGMWEDLTTGAIGFGTCYGEYSFNGRPVYDGLAAS